MFKIGEEVVCIDDSFCILRMQCPPELVTPVKGEVYTVRGVVYTENGLGVWLNEIDNKHVAPDRPECNFRLGRFRKVAEVTLRLEVEEEVSQFEPA